MKTIIALCLILSASVFAGYDYVINEYGPSKTLQNSESLFMTGDGGMYSLTLYSKKVSEVFGRYGRLEPAH
jgi:hypothetical protein